jgi:hypothetical protein
MSILELTGLEGLQGMCLFYKAWHVSLISTPVCVPQTDKIVSHGARGAGDENSETSIVT